MEKHYWNNFIFKRIKDTITFIRDKNGIQRKMRYDLWLKRSPGDKPVRISFNIYKILNEIINAYNHSFLPENFKKKDGFNIGKKMSIDLGIVHQNYCGCIYSKRDRDAKLKK